MESYIVDFQHIFYFILLYHLIFPTLSTAHSKVSD